MHRRLAALLLVPLVAPRLPPAAAAADEPPRAVMPAEHGPLLREHCAKCHGDEKQEGTFRVDDLPFTITTVEAAERWQKVLDQLNAGSMPPDGEPQPDATVKTDFLDDLEASIAARFDDRPLEPVPSAPTVAVVTPAPAEPASMPTSASGAAGER